MTPPPRPSSSELVTEISSAKEDRAALHHIKKNLCVNICHILLPAAFHAAAAGNVTMKAALVRAYPYIKKLLS